MERRIIDLWTLLKLLKFIKMRRQKRIFNRYRNHPKNETIQEKIDRINKFRINE